MAYSTTQAAQTAPPAPCGLSDITDSVMDLSQSSKRVTVSAVIRAVGDASFAPILLLPALAVATPLSGVPFFSTVMGVMICLVAVQMVMRRDQLWLPSWILRREVRAETVFKAFASIKPIAGWLDRRTGVRLRPVVHRPLVLVLQLLCALSGAIMPILEFVPFSSSVMGVGVAILAFGMLSRDGLIVLLGIIPYGIVGWLIFLVVG